MEQLVINARERLLKVNREENLTGTETETSQISGQDEQADMDSVHGADARTEGTQKRTHMFYFVKYHQYELNPKMVCKIERAQLEIQKRKEIEKEIENLKDTLRHVKEERYSIICDLEHWKDIVKDDYWNSEYVEHIQEILNKDSRNNGTSTLPSKEDELLDLIKEKQRIRKDRLKSGEEKRIMSLNHRIRNQRLTSKEKATLLKLKKELETTSDKAINAAAEASLEAKNRCENYIRYEISLWRKQHKSIEEYVQFHVNLVEERNQQLYLEVSQLHKHLQVVDRKIQKLEEKINYTKMRIDKAHAVILNSENLLDKMNAGYLQNCELLEYADVLAKQNDLSALANLSNNEMDKFFMQWTNNKYFKEDYKSMIIPSLEKRGLCRDGRVANMGQIYI
ncbi:proton pump-interactor BIP103-like [Carex rostrata]